MSTHSGGGWWRPPGPEGPPVVVSVRIPSTLRDALIAEARARGVALQQVVISAIRTELTRCGQPKPSLAPGGHGRTDGTA